MELICDTKEHFEWLMKSEEIHKLNRTKFILKNAQPPGDILMLTACVRDIKQWYPNIQIGVDTSAGEIWDNNPNITHLDANDPDTFELDMQYEIIHESNEKMENHFIHGFINDFNGKTGYAVKLTGFKPDLYLTDDEKNTPVFDDLPEKFVILNAGGKTDFESKWWWNEAWCAVVNLCPDVTFVQIGKTDENSHVHEKINAPNCIDKLGQTSLREFIRLVYQSSGTLSVVTCLMHLAAAFDKHAAVIAGGHEPWWWEKYPGQDYFHTIGRLSCCRFGGCWKGQCENKNENNRQKCLELINPEDVAEKINGWFK